VGLNQSKSTNGNTIMTNEPTIKFYALDAATAEAELGLSSCDHDDLKNTARWYVQREEKLHCGNVWVSIPKLGADTYQQALDNIEERPGLRYPDPSRRRTGRLRIIKRTVREHLVEALDAVEAPPVVTTADVEDDMRRRNFTIWRERMLGRKLKDIAAEFGLSSSYIGTLVWRTDWRLRFLLTRNMLDPDNIKRFRREHDIASDVMRGYTLTFTPEEWPPIVSKDNP
jgi:hypothetical protein